jgi:P-loop containing dynein motor region
VSKLVEKKPEKYSVLNVTFSSRTSGREMYDNIESVTEKKRAGMFGPKLAVKNMIFFIDELHMPNKDKYGT